MPEPVPLRQPKPFRWYDREPLSSRAKAARRKLALMQAIERDCPSAYAAWLMSDRNPLVMATALDALAKPWR